MSTKELEAWFESAPEAQRPILEALRRLILDAVPGVSEHWKWSRPCYSASKGLVCYLQRSKQYATLGFQQGASLDDPKGLLEGTGKAMRHVRVAAPEGVDRPALSDLLRQAFERA